MKQAFKNIIVKLLWLQVARLRAKHKPITVAVAGSIGKTGTKTAIATVLSEHFKVQWQDGNYNDIVSVPLIFFGQKMPALYNPIGWLKVFAVSELYIQTNYKYQVVVVELGTDYRGNLDLFKKNISVDYGVLTAIAPEHMENFKDIDAVADEELTIADIATTVLVNTEVTDEKYIRRIKSPLTYGYDPKDTCSIQAETLTKDLKRPLRLRLVGAGEEFTCEVPLIGKQGLPAIAAATLLAHKLKLSKEEIGRGLDKLQPLQGRMNPLKGVHGSLLIDDTYNSSPEAAIAALDTLYEVDAKQKIAVLGRMNELGSYSRELHQKVGDYCDPEKLDLLVTIGDDANDYIAGSAEKRGCRVFRSPTPYHAADVVASLIHSNTVVLAKGSQNGVYAEEAVKLLLKNSEDISKLVRQSKSWLKIKEDCFSIKQEQ